MAKIDEILYPTRLDSLEWLRNKPFGPAHVTAIHLRDFGNILDLLDLPAGSRILDLGVGSGWTSRWLTRCGYRVTGLDISPGMIDIAREQAEKEEGETRFLAADLEELGNLDLGTFDGCLAYDVLHHVEKLDLTLEAVAKTLLPGGRFLALEPNWNHRFSFESVEAVRRFGVREEGISPRRFRRILKRSGFSSITRYHCSDGLYDNSAGALAKHLFRPLLHRLMKAHYATRVYMLAIR